MLLEYREMNAIGPHFRIIHEFRMLGTDCAPGEKLGTIYIAHGSRQYAVPLPLTLRLLFDFLAKHARVSLNASEIAVLYQADKFYQRHGSNVVGGRKLIRRVTRSAVRVYVQRIREALTIAFQDANLRLDPKKILISEGTVTNEVKYRLRASFEWLHTDSR